MATKGESYDPEEAGYFISKNIPKEASRDDFQHYPMWRDFNYAMLSHIHKEYKGTIIVPMTVVDPMYFNEIVGRLRTDGITVNHFTLLASKAKILHRLLNRGDGPNSWAAQQIDRCLAGLSNKVFKQHLNTDDMTVEAVVEHISFSLSLGNDSTI